MKNNYQRKVRHYFDKPFEKVEEIVVNVTATNGIANAHIFEIRVYDVDGVEPFPQKM